MTRPARVRSPYLLMIGALVCVAACGSSDAPGRGPTRPAMAPVSLPDLSRTDDIVQAQARERYAALTTLIETPSTSTADLGAAYGELGMFLHAIESLDAAEPAYRNAQTLLPDDGRWPYYLARVYHSRGEIDEAIAAFQRARVLRPNDVAIPIWMGRLLHQMGRPDEAEPLFEQALALAPRAIAALHGLGQTALARNDYTTAARHLERALEIDPEAAALHTPLAMAYRGLGEQEKAEAHLKLWRNREIAVPDPLKDALDASVESGLSYEVRGVAALEAEQWTVAADFFRRGVAITPGTTPLGRSLRHKLATALVLSGDMPGAIAQFEDVVRFAPDGPDEASSKAHYSLGVLMVAGGRDVPGIEHLTRAVAHSPNYTEAHVALADALRRTGRVAASLPHYQEAIRISPRDASYARFGYAMALVRLERYREARDWLTEAMRLHPDEPTFTNALARILAAAPDDRVRDGLRALALVKELLSSEPRTITIGETMAMTLAEVGIQQDAVSVQRGVLEAARRAGLQQAIPVMEANLRLYEQGQASRQPWAPDDPAHRPAPPGEDSNESLAQRTAPSATGP